jgi:phosphopantetheinyl transferase
MPVILKKTTREEVQIGIWKIIEEEGFFLDRMPLTAAEEQQLAPIKGQRRVHWLASRYLIHLLTAVGTRIECLKDEHGKPYLADSNLEISFSHSGDLAAVALGKRTVGVDIQTLVPKIGRIAHKFIRDDETVPSPEVWGQHIIWGAKEAAYKAYGKRQLDFRQNMFFNCHEDQGLTVDVEKDDFQMSYLGRYEKWGNYVLVYLQTPV